MNKITSQFIQYDSAYQHAASGEMFVPASDGSGRLIPTGWYFEHVTQSLPSVMNMEGPRTPGVPIRPWAFASLVSAGALLGDLQALLGDGIQLSVEAADENTQFPYSHRQWQITAKRGDSRARINAGLLASNIARSTALLDGQVKQFPRPALEAAAGELLRELDREQ
jgi:hypothetical protein